MKKPIADLTSLSTEVVLYCIIYAYQRLIENLIDKHTRFPNVQSTYHQVLLYTSWTDEKQDLYKSILMYLYPLLKRELKPYR